MKKRAVAVYLAAMIGLVPCGANASQANESQAVEPYEMIEQTQEKPVQQETVSTIESENSEVQIESAQETQQEESAEQFQEETSQELEVESSNETESETQTEFFEETVAEIQGESEEETQIQSNLEAQATECIQTEEIAAKTAAPEGDGMYFGEQDENDLLWASQNAQGEVCISQVQLLRSLLAKVGKGYSQAMRYDANYYDCSSLILRCLQEFGLTGVPYSTYDWNNRLEGKHVGDVITFHGSGNYVSYRIAAVNTDAISNPDAFLVPGTISVLISPGYSGGHVAVSLGSFARQDNGLDPVTNAVGIVNQTRSYVAAQLAARYGVDQSILMGTNSITGYLNTWMDSDWLGTDMLIGNTYSGTYNRIWRVEAFNPSTGVCVTNVARGTHGLTAKYVLVPVETDADINETLSIDNIQVSNISADGYQVDVTFSATYGASRVLMPTWTEAGGQDDLIWHTAKVDGNTASFYIKTQDHKNEGGHYITHIYIYGQTGKYCIDAADVYLPVKEIKDYNGLHKEIDGASYYYSNGKLAGDYTGLVLDQNVWYYVRNGKLDESYSGLVSHRGDWYYVENGRLNWDYTGLVLYNGRWYCVQNGYLDWNYSGLVEYYGTTYYVYKGELNWGYYGLVYDNGIWQFVRSGKLDQSYIGLVKHTGEWYYVSQGSVDWTYTGPVEYYGTWYNIRNGYLNWTYSGSTELDGIVYQVKNGIVLKNEQ